MEIKNAATALRHGPYMCTGPGKEISMTETKKTTLNNSICFGYVDIGSRAYGSDHDNNLLSWNHQRQQQRRQQRQ